MPDRSANWYRAAAVGSVVAALVGAGGMAFLDSVTHSNPLPLWAHIPVAGCCLTLIGGGGLSAGVAYLEYKVRLARDGQQA